MVILASAQEDRPAHVTDRGLGAQAIPLLDPFPADEVHNGAIEPVAIFRRPGQKEIEFGPDGLCSRRLFLSGVREASYE
jgi:hypothetical protein